MTEGPEMDSASDKNPQDSATASAKLLSDDIRRRERRRRRAGPAWSVLSLAMHGLVFVILVMFTPVRELIIPEEKETRANPAEDLSADRIEQIGDSLSRARVNELLSQLEALQAVLHNMDLMKEELQSDYDSFAESSAETAKEIIEKAVDDAKAQTAAVKSRQKEILELSKRISDESKKDLDDAERAKTLKSSSDAIYWDRSQKLNESLAVIQNALDRAQVTAEFAGYEKTASAAENLRDAQIEVAKMQANASNEASDVGSKLSQMHEIMNGIRDAQKEIDEQKPRYEEAEKKRNQADKDIESAVKQVRENQNGGSDAKRRLDDARRREEDAKRRESDAKRREDDAKRRESDASKRMADAQKQLTAAGEKLAKAEALKSENEKKANEDERKAREEERKAKDAEKKAVADETKAKTDREKAVADAGRAVADRDKAREDARVSEENVKTRREEERKARDAENKARGERAEADRTMRDAKWKLDRANAKLEENKKRKEALSEVVRGTDLNAAPKKLENARADQNRVAEQIEKLKLVLESEVAKPEKLVDENRTENRLVTKNVSRLTLAEAYETARQIEDEITESFKDIKATQTAIERKMSFEAAQKLTDVAKSVRMEISEEKKEAIEKKPRTKEELDLQKEAQMDVVREADNIVDTAVSMMLEAMALVPTDESEKSSVRDMGKTIPWLEKSDFELRSSDEAREARLAQMNDEADYSVAMQQAAAEDSSGKVQDIAALMTRDEESAEGSPEFSPATAGGAGVREPPKRGSGGRVHAVSAPQIAGTRDDLIPGNVLNLETDVGDGIPGSWMFVNSWYVIGPFPNPGRINLRRKFPPESVIDLDATYPGKDGKTLRWEYRQSRSSLSHKGSRAEVLPSYSQEYAIWYAYTEVFVDRDCDLWVAIGSDDRSDVWLNDLPIWGSGNNLKEWKIDEGFRRVHFRKGRNTMLMRLENGHGPTGFSICICVNEDATSL